MRLYVVRHAKAAPGEPDALRPLTHAGHEAARALARRLVDDGVSLDAVLTSPLLRARQTGEALARAAGIVAEPDERLAPGATAAGVRAVTQGRGDHVAVVGHQPDCSQIVATLTGGPEPAFPTGGMVAIDL